MRVLLAGKYVPTGPNPIGGLQSWIKTVRAELQRLGHEVAEWQPGMQLSGVFDLGIVANLSVTRPVLNFCRRSACVSHGIIDAERPEAGCDRYVFVSEGVRDHWGMAGDIIRQPIDLEFWSPGNQDRAWVTRYSYRTASIHGDAASDALGLPYRHVMNVTHEEARDALRSSALVFASGRAALESMACGAPTVIYDHRAAYQGPLLGKKLSVQRENSYSGRGEDRNPSLDDVLDECDSSLLADPPEWRRYVEKFHDVRKIVPKLLC